MIVYLVDFFAKIPQDLFLLSGLMTGLAFVGISLLKSYVGEQPLWRGALETFGLGSGAALLAYFAGNVLEGMFT